MKCGPARGPRGPSKKGRFCFLWGITSIQSTVCTEQNNYQATITIRYHIAEVPYYDNVHCIRLARLRLCWLVLGHCHVHLWGGHLITIDNCSADLLCRAHHPRHNTTLTTLHYTTYITPVMMSILSILPILPIFWIFMSDLVFFGI